jgi:hypothetical protein
MLLAGVIDDQELAAAVDAIAHEKQMKKVCPSWPACVKSPVALA